MNMAKFEDVLNKMKDVAVATGQKASDIAAKTKIKMEISSLQKKQAAAYEGIGRLVYDAQKNGTDIEELKNEAIEAIDELQEEIKALEDKIFELDGAIRCDECGIVNDGDAGFCKKCGKAL